jgi:hypothetical protein
MKELEKRLASDALAPRQRFRLLMELAVERIRHSDPAECVELVEEAWTLLQEALPDLRPGPETAQLLANLHMVRALAHMRLAETQNCVARHSAESCLLPIRGGGIHSLKDPARRARASFEDYLRIRPEDLSARWLLNIVNMTLGEYPRSVPSPLLIPPRAFAPDKEIGRFVEIAPQLAINTYNLAGGVVTEDVDNDGFLDIVTSTWDPHRRRPRW